MTTTERSRQSTAGEGVELRHTYYTELATPIGAVVVTSDGSAITGVYMESHRHAPVDRSAWIEDSTMSCAPLKAAREQMEQYFSGQRTEFDLPLNPSGTEVQKRVWGALKSIPYGETRSYGEIAAAIGSPKASRAVGAANGRNPLSIIVPCHRVIGSSGALTGFGGGVERKEWLLTHESRVSGTVRRFRSGARADKATTVVDEAVPQV